MPSKLCLPLLLGALFWIWDFDDGTAYADVRDTTSTFSQEAVKQANGVIDEIHQKYGRDVVVEVLPSAGGQSYSELVNSRARQAGVNGVYVLITRNPGHVEVWVHNDAARGMTAQDRQQLSNRLIGRFRNREFDQGLLEGVQFVRQSFFANLGARSGQPNYNPQSPAAGGAESTGAPPPQQKSTGLGWFWWVIIIGVGLFLLMRFMRRRQQAYSPGHGTLPGQPGNRGPREPHFGQQYPGGATGAGGWGRGMLGGLMGGMAGGWLYDKMRGGGGGAGGGGTAYGDPGAGAGGADQFGGSSSGGDFDAGGGGDFGGGESSGGDF